MRLSWITPFIHVNRCLHVLPAAALLGLDACTGSRQSATTSLQREIRITATDAGFESPDSVSAGLVHVTFENRGSTIHEAMFIKLPEGMDAERYLDQVRGGASFPKGALDYSGPGLTSPGGQIEQWLHLDPGRYLLGCWFNGHLETNPARLLIVAPSDAPDVEPPAASIVLRLVDFHFQLNGQLASGAQVVRVEAVGPSLHEVDIFRLHPGKTLADFRTWRAARGKLGPAPAEAIGGVLDSHQIPRVVWLRTTFRPGRYVLWCGMDMEQDGAQPAKTGTHADAGMFLEFEIAG